MALEYSRLPDDFVLTEELGNSFSLAENGGDSLFITGKAGTGKSTFIDYFRENTAKNTVYLAPTGVAALNIRGKTIHSLFQFPPKIISKDEIKDNKYNKKTRELFANLQTMIIDEISMARADIIDGIDFILKENRHNEDPFGGVQMIFVGDLYQLPPVISDREKVTVTFNGKLHYEGTLQGYFEKIYRGQYFFNSKAFRNASFKYLEFKNIFRQRDDLEFIGILNAIRENTVTAEILDRLNTRHIPEAGPEKTAQENSEPVITLCTTNARAKEINDTRLSELDTMMYMFEAEMSGEFETSYADNEYPADRKLYLKVNSQVMMIKNDREKRWVNGSMGIVKSLKPKEIVIRINGADHRVEKETWETVEYEYSEETKSVNTRVTGLFSQYPLKLAWAITIHKSQGKTFDNVIIDLEKGAFAHGQTYVALSRCRSLDGITLSRPVSRRDIILDPRVTGFFTRP
ncbi:MAG: AAA family ATPase [Treponema sp.]|nr:AAA family ATPase [Treponema sp.]